MTISEASKKWGVSEKTILIYIYKEYIFELSIENNRIIIPDFNKPYIKNLKDKEISVIDNAILKSLNELKYYNFKIANIDREIFIERMKTLERDGKIYTTNENPCYDSNINFIISSNINKNNNKKNIKLDIKNNATMQIGFINISKN